MLQTNYPDLTSSTPSVSEPDVSTPVVAAPIVLEPILAIEEIQGNILGGFNKDHEMLLFLKITDIAAAKQWLRMIEPYIATAAEVIKFNQLFKKWFLYFTSTLTL